MAVDYPGSLDEFIAKVDGPANWVNAAHINKIQQAIVAIETELGTDPAGSLSDVKTRLAVRLNNNGTIKQPQQLITVGKTNCDFTSILLAVQAISDAASDKIYTILVFPGIYTSQIVLKNYVNIYFLDLHSTFTTLKVQDGGSSVNCYLRMNIALSIPDYSLILTGSSNIIFEGIASGIGQKTVAALNGTSLLRGHFSNTSGIPIYAVSNSNFLIENSVVECTWNNSGGHGIELGNSNTILQDVKILCTHADAKGLYASAANDVRCMSTWANRDDHANVTQLIAGGYNFDANVA